MLSDVFEVDGRVEVIGEVLGSVQINSLFMEIRHDHNLRRSQRDRTFDDVYEFVETDGVDGAVGHDLLAFFHDEYVLVIVEDLVLLVLDGLGLLD